MKTYRDGRPVQPEIGPASTAAPRPLPAPDASSEPSTPSGKRKNYRGNEEHEVGYHSDRPGPAGVAANAYVATLIQERDLVAAADALERRGLEAWVTIVTPQGPEAVGLSAYLRRQGAM